MSRAVTVILSLIFAGVTGVARATDDLRALVAAADPGATIIVPAGIHAGTIVIDKPLTLIAEPGAIIDAQGSGDAVRITAPNVTIRGFTIRNTGISLDRENAAINITKGPHAVIENNTLADVLFGVYLRESSFSVIRNNTIGGKDLELGRRGDAVRIWQSHDCVIEDNIISLSRDAVLWFSNRTVIRRNHVSGGRYGMHFMYADDNVLEDNTLTGNSVGAFLMYSKNLTLRRNRFIHNRGPSGFGLGLKDVDGLHAEHNLFASNRAGVQADNSPANLDIRHVFTRNVFAFNDQGVAFMPSVQRNDFTNNTFLDNTEQVAVLGRGELTDVRFTIEGVGNFWSDYPGFDADRDGVGDLPHRSESLFESIVARDSRLRLFLHSPVQIAVESAARIAPVVRPQPRFVDEAPLMEPPRLPESVLAAAGTSAGARRAGLLMLLVGALIAAAMIPFPERPRRARTLRASS